MLTHNTCSPEEEERIEWLKDEIDATEGKINSIADDEFGYGKHNTSGSQSYLDQLYEELAKLTAKQGNPD